MKTINSQHLYTATCNTKSILLFDFYSLLFPSHRCKTSFPGSLSICLAPQHTILAQIRGLRGFIKMKIDEQKERVDPRVIQSDISNLTCHLVSIGHCDYSNCTLLKEEEQRATPWNLTFSCVQGPPNLIPEYSSFASQIPDQMMEKAILDSWSLFSG